MCGWLISLNTREFDFDLHANRQVIKIQNSRGTKMDKQLYLMNRYQKDDNTIAYAFSEGIVLIKREYVEDGTAELFEIIISTESSKAKSKRRISDSEMKVDEFDTMKKLLTKSTNELHKTDVKISRRDCDLEKLENTEMACLPSVEEEYIAQFDENGEHQKIQSATHILMTCLTNIQRKRYIQNKIKGEPTRKIAEKEGVSQRTVQDSIEQAEKKIKIFLEKAKIDLSKPSKNVLR